MYLVAKLHPKVTEYESDTYQGDYLSLKDQEKVIRDFYTQERDIPLCIDHLGIDSTGFVRHEDRVGRVVDLFTNKDHELMVKCQLFPEHEAYYTVNHSIFHEKKKWGVSVGLANLKDPEKGTILEKNLVHVALTTDPAFGAQNSYLFDWGLFEEDIDRKIAQKYVGSGYTSDVFKKKMALHMPSSLAGK
jgi:hypothetical protein